MRSPNIRRRLAGSLLVTAGLVVAACGSSPAPTVEPDPSPSSTPGPTNVMASPSVVSSALPSAAAPAVTPAAPQPTSRPEPPGPTLSPAEFTLTFYVREDVATDCQPRRQDLPPGARTGIECSSGSNLVERVGVYAFDSREDQLAAYRGRMKSAGIRPRSGDCRAGEAGDRTYWDIDEAAFEPYSEEAEGWGNVIDGLPYLPSRLGCFRDQFGAANIRVTCEDGTYIGVLGRTDNIRDLTAWAYHPALEGEPGICVGASRDGS